MANLIPESGDGTIDRELLRDKFTGRSNLFFNPANAGGVRSSRKALDFQPEILQLDPAVKYRAFSSQTAANDFLQTGLIAGRGNYENALYFNQGVPLLSYAQTDTPNQRFLLATLGDEWGDRTGTTLGKNGMAGNLDLSVAQDGAAFSVTPPITISDNPYTEKIGDLSAPDLKAFKALKDLKKYAKGINLKYFGKAAGTEKGLPRPTLYPDRRVTDDAYAKEHLPKLTEIKKEFTRIADYLLSPDVQVAIKHLEDRRKANPKETNPLLEYYVEFFRTVDDGHLRGWQDQIHGGRYPVQIPPYYEGDRDIFDNSPENVKKLKGELKVAIDGFLDSTIAKDKIVPFDKTLSYFPDGVTDVKYPTAHGVFGKPTPAEIAYRKKNLKKGSSYLQHGVAQHTAGVMNNPSLNPHGIEGYATTWRSTDLVSLLESTERFFDPKNFHTAFAVTDTPEKLPFGGFSTNYEGNLRSGEWLDRQGKPLVPMTPQEGMYVDVPPQVKTSLTSPSGSPLLRVTPKDESVFSTPEGVLGNLNNVFDQSINSWGKGTKIRNLEIPSMGIGGAMYSEVLPTAQILGNYIDPTTKKPREWQVLAPNINPQDGLRPTVLFQIMDDGTHKVLKQYNNEPTSEGWTPIPTKTLAPEKQKEAYVRYLEEMVQSVNDGKKDLVTQKPEIFSEIFRELPQNLTPSQTITALKGITPSQLESVAARLIASDVRPSQIIDVKYGNYGEYLPTNQKYLKLGGLVDEATRGNPNYGRKGFAAIPKFLEKGVGNLVLDAKINMHNADAFRTQYVNNSQFRGAVNKYVGGQVPKVAAGALAGLHLKSKIDEGMPIAQAVPVTAAEIGIGVAKFKLFDRFFGGVTDISPISDTSTAAYREFAAAKKAERAIGEERIRRREAETKAKLSSYENSPVSDWPSHNPATWMLNGQ